MKTLWIIPIVVLSVFACSETKEKPLAPIYADAFYEPDFIPYLMLKHGVDTIKEIYVDGDFCDYNKETIKYLHFFNFNNNTYFKLERETIFPNRKIYRFNSDSLINLSIEGSCTSIMLEYEYERNTDSIIRIATDFYGGVFNDSIYEYPDNQHQKQHFYNSYFILNNNKIHSFFEDTLLLKSITYSSENLVSEVLSKYSSISMRFMSCTKEWCHIEKEQKNYTYDLQRLLRQNIMSIDYLDQLCQETIIYYEDHLPARKVVYDKHKTDSIVFIYQVIRNAKK
jgi:hypothetical protein